MKAAICDDEILALNSLRLMLERHEKIQGVRSFLSPEFLLEIIEEGEVFDLVFMDIEWKQSLNGIDFASALNRSSPCTQIIYVTSYNDRFSQRIFLKPSNLCGYLLKPVDPALLHMAVEKAWNTLQTTETKKLLVQCSNAVHAVPLHTICYLESRGHQLLIHTGKDTIICYERLELIKRKLPKQFMHCHKSYLVNMDYIRRIGNRQVLLKQGEELPISKARYAEVRSAYFRYMGEQL